MTRDAKRENAFNALMVDPVTARDLLSSPFDDLLDHFWSNMLGTNLTPPNKLRQAFPRVDVLSDNDNLYIQAALPGYNLADVQLEVKDFDRTITLKGKSSYSREDKRYLIREIKRSAFERCVNIPEDFDIAQSSAEFKDGILTITVPRFERVKECGSTRPLLIKSG